MKIKISELFEYCQYVAAPVYYCFDRKEYRICDVSAQMSNDDTPYERYIPLLRIDEKAIQDHFIRSLNDKYISREYKQTTLCFNAFVEVKGLWRRWWEYYTSAVFDFEKSWCEENNIQYEYDLQSYFCR